MALMDHNFSRLSSNQILAGSLLLYSKTLKKKISINKIKKDFDIKNSKIKELAIWLFCLLYKESNNLKACKRKFEQDKFHKVSQIKLTLK